MTTQEFLKSTLPCWATLGAVFCHLTYFQHFNFENPHLRLAYVSVFAIYCLLVIIFYQIVACCYKKHITHEQKLLKQYMELTDGQDKDEHIILSKIKMNTIQRNITLQRWCMPILQISGWFKVISQKDFIIQIYIGLIVEMLAYMPILLMMMANNYFLGKWNAEFVVGCGGVGAVLFLNFKKLRVLDD